jgi:hypothetical protein
MAAQAEREPISTHQQVRRMLARAFAAEERVVLKTQQFDAAPGSSSDPDRLYHPVADGSLGRARCGRVLSPLLADVVAAYWTARGLARERQTELAKQLEAGKTEQQVSLRELSPREAKAWEAKDLACRRLVPRVRGELRLSADVDLVTDLIREWAGLLDGNMRARMAAEYQRNERTVRKVKNGRPERGRQGVQQYLDDKHNAAIDTLAHHLAPEDLEHS